MINTSPVVELSEDEADGARQRKETGAKAQASSVWAKKPRRTLGMSGTNTVLEMLVSALTL